MKLISLLTALLFYTSCLSQLPHVSRISSYEINHDTIVNKKIVLTMSYGKAEVVQIHGDTSNLKNAGDLLIEIVCTDYPSIASHNDLNDKRFRAIFSIFPYLSINLIRSIQVVRQMNGEIKEKALDMFHGVVITYRPRQSKETMKRDLLDLSQLIRIDLPPDTTKHTQAYSKKPVVAASLDSAINNLDTLWNAPEIWRINSGRERRIMKKEGHNKSCIHVIKTKAALDSGYISRDDYHKTWKQYKILTIAICMGHGAQSLPPYYLNTYKSADKIKMPKQLTDSTLIKVFTRNKWRRMSVTSDLTGSMYPYTAQLLIWLKLQSLDSFTTQYTFFNDGDNKMDHNKIIGNTGGIYSKQLSSINEVIELIKTCMTMGSGGDLPENNIEALLESEKNFPEAQFNVLIADNWAPIKDLQLVHKLGKPVRVVLCGTFNGWINLDYLNLARLTGGSLHLIEDDILNLAAIKEGQSIQIGQRTYKISNGRFIEALEINESSL